MSASPRLPERLGLAVLDQAATKSDVGAVDPNGDIVTGVAGAGVKYLERAKVGRGCWFDPAIGGESQAVLRRTIPLRGKLSSTTHWHKSQSRRMQRPYAHLVLMRVSHHCQRDRQVDLLLDPVEDLGGLVIGPGGIDHQHAAAIPDDQTVGSDCPGNPACRDRKRAARHSVRAGGKPDRQTVGRQLPFAGQSSGGFHRACTRSASMQRNAVSASRPGA